MENIGITMARRNLEGIPRYELSSPYRLRWYEAGDDAAWVDIHRRADPFNTATAALYRKEFGEDEALLSTRQLYLLDGNGRPVGTATAWFNGPNPSPAAEGRVHWVAIVPAHQGKGLSKPLLAAVCLRLAELGHGSAMLDTSSARIAAVRLYLSFGFEPEIRRPGEEEGWRQLARTIEFRSDQVCW